jgi:hypothetical protein
MTDQQMRIFALSNTNETVARWVGTDIDTLRAYGMGYIDITDAGQQLRLQALASGKVLAC